MKHYQTPDADVVPLSEKIAFGAGNLANQLFPAALGVFSVVLVLSLGFDPLLAGILGAIPRLIDAVTDPVMGYLSDNTRSRWGRRRPYIFIGAVIAGIAYMLMWQLYPENSVAYNFTYTLSFSILCTLGMTIFAVPLIGMGYEMTPDYHERTRLMATSQWLGQFAWMIAPWFWVIIYDPELFANPPEGARTMALWVGGLCMLLGIMPALFCKELVLPEVQGHSRLSFKAFAENLRIFARGIKQTLTCKPFIRLCGATFLIFNGYQTIAQFAFFIIIFYLFSGNTEAAGNWPAWFGTVSAIATAFLVIPLVSQIAQRIGKRRAFVVATALSIVGYLLKWWGFNPANPWLMFLPVPFLSFGIGGLFTLMMSMTADVCDLDELDNGERREAIFGAVYWLMVKLGGAVALILSGAILNLVGFDQNAAAQTVETLTWLRIADITLPILTGVMAILVMWGYDITEERAHEIRLELEARRGTAEHA
ncbi:MAG: MFS transporter [Halieaceae bacterium]|jgi:GPH family glycoside/pentoside/hexuronide:cation symporter|nr:MFS transporter [Halieaceae bacterium]